MAEQAIARLQAARTVPEISAAMLAAFEFGEDPAVHAEMKSASRRRMERAERQAKLSRPTTVAVARQASHTERERLLTELRERRANGRSLAGIEKEVKDYCRDDRCSDCSSSLEFQSLCLSFMLECIAIRIKRTMVRHGAIARYNIDPDLSDLMLRFIADPVNVWLDHTNDVFAIGDRLENEYHTKVEPFTVQPHPEPVRKQAKSFKRHYKRIKDLLAHLRTCERSNPT